MGKGALRAVPTIVVRLRWWWARGVYYRARLRATHWRCLIHVVVPINYQVSIGLFTIQGVPN